MYLPNYNLRPTTVSLVASVLLLELMDQPLPFTVTLTCPYFDGQSNDGRRRVSPVYFNIIPT